MGNKIPLFISTLTILASILPVPSVNAAEIDPSSYNWSIDDLIEIKREVDDELQSLCMNDQECRRNIKDEKIFTDYRYNLAEGFDHTLFAISAINPSASTIRVFFHDEVESPMMMEETERATIEGIYLYWFEDGAMDYSSFHRKLTSGTLSFGENVFTGETSTLGANWLAPNQEVELNIENTEILSRAPRILEYYAKADITDVVSSINYDSCIASPYYHAGMECRLLYNSWLEQAYFPFEPGEMTPIAKAKAATTATLSSVEQPATASSDNLEPANDTATNDIADNPSDNAISSTENGKSGVIAEKASTDAKTSVKSPETGVGKYQESSEFPWWLGLIIVLGLGTLAWFFWPFHKQKRHFSQKSQKTTKNS